MKKKYVILVSGGDSYSNREDFIQSLRTREMWDLPTETEQKSWKSNLVAELGDGYVVDIPTMPNKQNAHYDEWKIWFERHLAVVDHEVTLIGYSLGAMFLAKYLIENKVGVEIKGLFLLAGPCGTFDDDTGNDCGSFEFDESELDKLAAATDSIAILHSKDDFIVPYEHALRYQAKLPTAKLVSFEDKNHFLVPELPELVGLIREL